MFDKKKFNAALALKGMCYKDVAEALNIDVSTLWRKMNGVSDFYRNEIQTICKLLDLVDPMEIFFAE